MRPEHKSDISTPLQAWSRQPFVLFDGAVGTELRLRGVDMEGIIDGTDIHDDYWTGRALITDPAAVRQLHEDYIQAGADVITTNTFRTNPYAVEKAGCCESFRELTRHAVSLACGARDAISPRTLVAGSVGSLGSFQNANSSDRDEDLEWQHGNLTAELAACGVDLIVLETLDSTREAHIASACARRSGVPFVTSFALRRVDGRLGSGEHLADAAQAILSLEPLAILVNCTHQDVIEPALHTLGRALAGTGVWFGAQPHLDKPPPGSGWQHPGNCTVEQYVAYARRWLDTGAKIMGGCCGTNPEYIAALARWRKELML